VRRLLPLGGAGLVAAWCLALALGDGIGAATEVVVLAAGSSLILFLAAGLLLNRLAGRALAVHLWAATTTTVLGVAAGVLVASWRMFLSASDARAILVILAAAGTVAMVGALLMASRLNSAVLAIGRMAAHLGQPPSRMPPPEAVQTRELSVLAAQLHQVGEELHASILRERSLEASRRELVAWISHDLRTPLAGIRAVTEALQDGVVTDAATVRQYHEIIRTEVDRLSGMVDDLFRLSRIHAGLTNLRVEAASLKDLVSDALSVVAPAAEARRIKLRGQVPDKEVQVSVAPTEFLRVLRNLLDNALRHTPEGGEISVHAQAAPDQTVVRVRDGCGGIPEVDLERVFDVGYRGDLARSPGHGVRAGLGLAIAQGLVSAHGGRIDVDNEERGCCFTVRLPGVRPLLSG
jgi:signal transduction histidine kinase